MRSSGRSRRRRSARSSRRAGPSNPPADRDRPRFWPAGAISEHGTRAAVHGFAVFATRGDHTIAPMPTDLRSALNGVRAFVLDADGVLMYRGQPIPGAPEALTELRRRQIPYRVVTNFSSAHRSSLAAAFGKSTGLAVDGGEIITAASAAAAYTAGRHPGAPLLVLAQEDA